MTTRRMYGMCGLALALAAAAAAQDKAAGPSRGRKGEPVPATFRAFLVVDDRFPSKADPAAKDKDAPPLRDPRDRTAKIHCLVCETGLSPAVAVFVRADPKTLGPDSGVVKLAARLNELVRTRRADKLAGWVHFLRLEGPPKAVPVPGGRPDAGPVELDAEYPDDERRDEYARSVGDLAKAARDQAAALEVDARRKAGDKTGGGEPRLLLPFGLAPARGKTADAWGIGPDDEVTVVLYNRMRVADRWAFKADGPTDQQIDEIAAAVAALLDGKR